MTTPKEPKSECCGVGNRHPQSGETYCDTCLLQKTLKQPKENFLDSRTEKERGEDAEIKSETVSTSPKEEWEERFDKLFKEFEFTYKDSDERIKDFIRTELKAAYEKGILEEGTGCYEHSEQARKEGAKAERERVLGEAIDVVENGGTPETILEIEHNGEKFINERHLVKALRSKLQSLKEDEPK